MNILVTTLGTSWAVVPELLGFLNPEAVPLLQQHRDAVALRDVRKKWAIEPVDAVWVATTTGERVRSGVEKLQTWQTLTGGPPVSVFTMEGVAELATVEECLQMRELIFRLVLHARTAAGNGKLYLSLAGGRKTMSADMQLAAETFGCDLLLHIVEHGALPSDLRDPEAVALAGPLSADLASHISPIIIRGASLRRPIFQLPEAALEPAAYPLPAVGFRLQPTTALVERVRTVEAQAGHLMLNFTTQLVQSTKLANFHALYNLPPEQIERLQLTYVGRNEADAQRDLKWLRRLPKAELHCHLGGILNAEEHLVVAEALRADIEQLARQNPQFAAWLRQLQDAADLDIEQLRDKLTPGGWKAQRDRFGSAYRHLATAAFLLFALGTAERVDAYIFGKLVDRNCFHGIDIKPYEALGDLQGSSLLQCRATIEAACTILIEQCRRENITYCELRCSPLNCCHAGLSAVDVANILAEQLCGATHTQFKLIFIASRHGVLAHIEKTINLVRELAPEFVESYFAGFDLAGAEDAMQPAQVRDYFESALQNCHHITIHAGEGQPVDNIWQAVYQLNAERIGHALSLVQSEQLLAKFISRRIAVELCPSSNFQIVGFRDDNIRGTQHYKLYPIKHYLEKGLRVTINTDDPGMSRTSLSNEYLRAAQMTPGGLSRWEILQLARNSFKAAFVTPQERKSLILDAEKALMRRTEYLTL